MESIEYFKNMREKMCEEYLKIIPKGSVAYYATLKEKSFYDEAIEALWRRPCEDAISIKELKYLGAECIAKRDENGNLIPLGCIDNLPSVIPAENLNKWMPVSERLPETDGRFLTYIKNPYDSQLSYMMVCDYISQTWCPDDETASNNVIAWIPLPQPYKAESEAHDADSN